MSGTLLLDDCVFSQLIIVVNGQDTSLHCIYDASVCVIRSCEDIVQRKRRRSHLAGGVSRMIWPLGVTAPHWCPHGIALHSKQLSQAVQCHQAGCNPHTFALNALWRQSNFVCYKNRLEGPSLWGRGRLHSLGSQT